MALAQPDLRDALVAVRQSVRAAERVAEKLPEKVALLVVLAAVALAIVVASRIPVGDPMLRRLKKAPVDDEPLTPEDVEELRRARAEKAIPWETAKQQLSEPD